jgi:hypothetical protein
VTGLPPLIAAPSSSYTAIAADLSARRVAAVASAIAAPHSIVLVERAAETEDVLFFSVVPSVVHDHIVNRRANRFIARRASWDLPCWRHLVGHWACCFRFRRLMLPAPPPHPCGQVSSLRPRGFADARASSPPRGRTPILPRLKAVRNAREGLPPRWRRIAPALRGEAVRPSRRPGATLYAEKYRDKAGGPRKCVTATSDGGGVH